jgi:hypothetical protein
MAYRRQKPEIIDFESERQALQEKQTFSLSWMETDKTVLFNVDKIAIKDFSIIHIRKADCCQSSIRIQEEAH